MIISIKVSDDTYEKYGKHNSSNPRGAVEQVVERYADIGASGKAVVLSGENLKALQGLMGQIDEPADLVERVKKLLSARVDGVEFPLSEAQRKGVKDRAQHQAQPYELVFKQEVSTALRNALGV